MTTPAYGMDLPLFRPSQPEAGFSVQSFIQRVEALGAALRAHTTPAPAAGAQRAPVTTAADPELQSGERLTPAGRAALASMDEDTLVSERAR